MRTARSENSLQWPLGMTCREDESCIHIGHDAHNMSILRCQATLGSGLAAKRKQAGWDNEYLGAYIPDYAVGATGTTLYICAIMVSC
ncbi:MAG: hypothetical protein J4G06_08580, partial [Caldilineaceae bacterium]|nr:hypothetical protein [Caldilineaceae bacterium]